LRNQHYLDQPKEADKMTTEKRRRGRPKKVKEEPKEQLKRNITCKLYYETAQLKPIVIAELFYSELNKSFTINTLDERNAVHNALIDFEKSRVYTRIDAETELKTLVADTGNLDIWITDFENGRAFLEVGPDIAGIISIVLYSIAYEAE